MFSGAAVSDWITNNIIPIILAILTLSVLWAASTKKVRDFALGVGLGLAAIAFIVLIGNWQAVGTWITGIIAG